MVTGQLADMPTRGLPTHSLDVSWPGELTDWTSCGLNNSWIAPAVAVSVVITLICEKRTLQ